MLICLLSMAKSFISQDCGGDAKAKKGRNMSDNDREYPWSRKGEAYDEMFSESPSTSKKSLTPKRPSGVSRRSSHDSPTSSPVLPLRNSRIR